MMQAALVERNCLIFQKYLECESHEETALAFHLSSERIKIIVDEFVRVIAREMSRRLYLQRRNPARQYTHPFTFEKYPHLYEKKSGVQEFGSWKLSRGDILAEKQFAYDQVRVYAQNRLGKATAQQLAGSARQVERQKR